MDVTMPSAGILASRKRFRISRKIIKAFFAAIGFDGGVKQRDGQLNSLPACIGGEFGVLMDSANQLGAGL
jgi:hypothetical protein